MENNNKKTFYITWNKKVVSISVLALALFMLLSVSYAYFTTKVVGNEEAKTTRLTTATETLKLDGTTITSLENATPGHSNNIKFTVTNTGTADTTYDLDIINVINTFADTSDLVYTINCPVEGKSVTEQTEAPTKSEPLIEDIPIKAGEKQIYTMTLTFKNTNDNQNDNQGKMFSGKIQVNNLEDTSLYVAIINNNEIIRESPDFDKASPKKVCIDGSVYVCNEWGSELFNDGLYAANDNEGESYYFRGWITTNNVRFAEMDWKILRLNGDGSIRLILNADADTYEKQPYNEKENDMKYMGYSYDNNGHHCTQSDPCTSDYSKSTNLFTKDYDGTDSSVKKYLEETWYKEKLAAYDDKIALTTYCNDTSTVIKNTSLQTYGFLNRASPPMPTLICPNPTESDNTTTHNYGGIYKLKIGLPSIDELVMAGLLPTGGSDPFPGKANYLYKNLSAIWTMTSHNSSTPSMSGENASIGYFSGNEEGFGYLFGNVVSSKNSVIPVINLNPDVEFTTNGEGDPGSEDNPYIVS